MSDESPKVALQRAVMIIGGQTALATAIGVPQSYIWYWLNKAKRIPAEKTLDIERATEGQVTRSDLRPDLFPRDEVAA